MLAWCILVVKIVAETITVVKVRLTLTILLAGVVEEDVTLLPCSFMYCVIKASVLFNLFVVLFLNKII